ncbi:MAG: ATPase [Methanosphaera sp.]|nr:ATPase [Methanosphaera sp.]
MYTKQYLQEKIMIIREEIGHDDIIPDIKDVYYEDDEITIITPDRPEKSMIIGKGGWVVGRLKEELSVKSIHVISYTDILLKEYQLELSLKHVGKLIDNKSIPSEYEGQFSKIYQLLNMKHEKIYDNTIIAEYIKKNIKTEIDSDAHVIVALSGGVDSSFSTILLRAIGFNVHAITIDPGTIILPKQFRYNIDNLTNKIGITHEYIETDMNEVISDALNGTIHPCGRCSKTIEEQITQYATKNNINMVVFGDLSSTGSQSIVIDNDIIRINLPALFKMEKNEIKNIVGDYSVKKIKGYGCPLLVQVHKKYPQYRPFSIQRVLRETRAGVLEPGEALELIKTI